VIKFKILLSDCKHDEISCNDGKCKNRYSKKDGHKDCDDGSDETGSKYMTVLDVQKNM